MFFIVLTASFIAVVIIFDHLVWRCKHHRRFLRCIRFDEIRV